MTATLRLLGRRQTRGWRRCLRGQAGAGDDQDGDGHDASHARREDIGMEYRIGSGADRS
jgi:hypothetical protein